MHIYRTFASALVALVIAAPLQADPAATLREALASVPMLPDATEGPGFADLTVAADVLAVRDLTGVAEYFLGPLGPISLALPLGGAPQPTTNSERAWPQLVGFAPDDIRTVVNYGTPPRAAVRLTLEPGVTSRVEVALVANGYDRVESDDGLLFRRGGADYEISLLDRNPDDPFGGMLGQASRVLVQGDILTRSAGMPAIKAGATGPFWGDRPDLAALLDTLSALPEGTRVMRAQVLADPLAFAPREFTPDADEGPAVPGIPYWSLGMLLELVEGETHDAAALAAFVYATRDQAEEARQGVESGWTVPAPYWLDTPAERIGPAVPSIEGEGPFVLLVHVAGEWTTEGFMTNLPFRRLYEGYARRALAVFGPPP